MGVSAEGARVWTRQRLALLSRFLPQLTHPIDEHSPLRHYLPYFNRNEHGLTISPDPTTGLDVCVLPEHGAPGAADSERTSVDAVKSHLSTHLGVSAVAEPLVNLEIFVTFRVRRGHGLPAACFDTLACATQRRRRIRRSARLSARPTLTSSMTLSATVRAFLPSLLCASVFNYHPLIAARFADMLKRQGPLTRSGQFETMDLSVIDEVLPLRAVDIEAEAVAVKVRMGGEGTRPAPTFVSTHRCLHPPGHPQKRMELRRASIVARQHGEARKSQMAAPASPAEHGEEAHDSSGGHGSRSHTAHVAAAASH